MAITTARGQGPAAATKVCRGLGRRGAGTEEARASEVHGVRSQCRVGNTHMDVVSSYATDILAGRWGGGLGTRAGAQTGGPGRGWQVPSSQGPGRVAQAAARCPRRRAGAGREGVLPPAGKHRSPESASKSPLCLPTKAACQDCPQAPSPDRRPQWCRLLEPYAIPSRGPKGTEKPRAWGDGPGDRVGGTSRPSFLAAPAQPPQGSLSDVETGSGWEREGVQAGLIGGCHSVPMATAASAESQDRLRLGLSCQNTHYFRAGYLGDPGGGGGARRRGRVRRGWGGGPRPGGQTSP